MSFLILFADVVEKMILVGLGGLSVWSLSIIIDRTRKLRIQNQNNDFLTFKNEIKNHKIRIFPSSTDSTLLLSGVVKTLSESNQNNECLSAAVSSYLKEERLHLEKGLSVLATLGSNAPFVGLLGTVLGVIRAFAYLGSQSGTATVMTGISQALFATAFGLFVAIPAVIAFNYFTKKIKDLLSQAESLRDLYLSQLRGDDGRK